MDKMITVVKSVHIVYCHSGEFVTGSNGTTSDGFLVP